MNLQLLYTTFPNIQAAREIVAKLLEAKVIACANILPGAESHFRWEGKLQQESEVVVFAKTTEANYPHASAIIREHHPYDVPCIVTLPITDGLPDYMHWVVKEMG